jgi:uncharacterized membrane protein
VTTIEQSIEVAVPVRTAYDQWTQSETFPSFMEGVEEIWQLDETRDGSMTGAAAGAVAAAVWGVGEPARQRLARTR